MGKRLRLCFYCYIPAAHLVDEFVCFVARLVGQAILRAGGDWRDLRSSSASLIQGLESCRQRAVIVSPAAALAWLMP